MKEEYSVSVTTKLKPSEATELKDICNFGGIKQSEFVRQAIFDRLWNFPISNVAGNNYINYDSMTDSFLWSVETDKGFSQEILSNISIEFVEDLLNNLKIAINDRNINLDKKNEKSVAIPKRLLK